MKKFYISLLVALSYCLGVQAQYTNVALNKVATQSSTNFDATADLAVDGNINGVFGDGSVTHTTTEANAWWEVDLGESFELSHISLYNRTDCCSDRLQNYFVFVSENPFTSNDPTQLSEQDDNWHEFRDNWPADSTAIALNGSGRYVRIQLTESNALSLAEVKVWTSDSGLKYQTIDFPPISKHSADEPPFPLGASATSGLEMSYYVTGPAGTTQGLVLFAGTGGEVKVTAYQAGNEEWAAADPIVRFFDVIDPSTIFPNVEIRSVEEESPLYMDDLKGYLLTAKVNIEHDDLYEIGEVHFEIGNELIWPNYNGEVYWIEWAPENFLGYDLEVIAEASTGTSSKDSVHFSVVGFPLDQTVSTFDDDLISFPQANRTFTSKYDLPTSVGVYDQLTGYLDINCPTGGCDPYDRVAWIEVKDDRGDWIEIIRYITPFGIACNHVVDLTPYLHLLQGTREMRMFIDTWAKGWSVSLDLEYTRGEAEHDFAQIQRLWDGAKDFGNLSNLQPNDTIEVEWPSQTKAALLHMYCSGHGWGENNSGNAAEFYSQAVHHLDVNGAETFEQQLFYDCAPNPDGCNNQLGTWEYNRAGWCPGAIGKAWSYNLTPWIQESTTELRYIFDEDYVDYCHPANPDCLSGSTCTDCNAGYNPHYWISANLVHYSDSLYLPGPKNAFLPDTSSTGIMERNTKLRIFASPNPSGGMFEVRCFDQLKSGELQVMDLQGKLIMDFNIENQPNGFAKMIDMRPYPDGVYLIRIVSDAPIGKINSESIKILKKQ